MSEEKNLPFRIQTPSGYRKYLCSGLYLPSVTTVLSATESAKSKAGLKTWQANNPGALEEASKRGSAIHLGCENYLRGLDPGVPEEYGDFWNGITQYLDALLRLLAAERSRDPSMTEALEQEQALALEPVQLLLEQGIVQQGDCPVLEP